MSYAVLKAMAQWYTRVVHALVSATSTVEDAIVHGIAKIETAAWDVEGRIHEQALSAAHQLANKEHIAIHKAHDDAVAAMVRARIAMNASARQLEAKITKVDDALMQAITIHQG